MTRRRSLLLGLVACLVLPGTSIWRDPILAQEQAAEQPFDFATASRDIPKPREIYPYVQRDMIPMDLKIESDEVVTSDTDPTKRLRKITAHFNSLRLENRVWGHPCVIFMPPDRKQ